MANQSILNAFERMWQHTTNALSDVAYVNLEDNEDVVDTGSASNIIVDSALSGTSTNPVQNKIITEEISNLSKEIDDLRTEIGLEITEVASLVGGDA